MNERHEPRSSGEPLRWDGPLHILALDGGGIRGLFSAVVLAKLEEDHQVRVTDHFDLIVGTSTGGIIAVGLGMGIRPAALVDFYVRHGPEIFPRPAHWPGRGLRFLRSFLRYRYDPLPLRNALRDVLGDTLLGASRKRLVIPSYNVARDEVRLFKTPHHPRLARDWRFPAWQVAMATSAAPTYFPAFREIERMRLIDGGVWANNPTLVGIVEAKSLLGASLEQMKVLSLGTCDDLGFRPDALDNKGLLAWSHVAIDVGMRGQSVGAHNLAALLLGKGRVHRVDPKVPAKLLTLDGVAKKDDLFFLAAAASQHFGPVFKDEFEPHRSSEYTPFHFEKDPSS